jgi:hypothetical protein
MKKLLYSLAMILVISSCKNEQTKSIIKKDYGNRTVFDISLVDSMIKKVLKPVDSITFKKYIASNPLIRGVDYSQLNFYGDYFWSKKYSDSIKNNLIFNTYSKSNYFFVPYNSINNSILLVLIYHSSSNFERIALYLIKPGFKGNYPPSVLLAEKIKGGGSTSIDLLTKSVMIDSSIIEQTTITKSCILDLLDADGTISCCYDTTTTYFKISDRFFDPYKRKIIWEAKRE